MARACTDGLGEVLTERFEPAAVAFLDHDLARARAETEDRYRTAVAACDEWHWRRQWTEPPPVLIEAHSVTLCFGADRSAVPPDLAALLAEFQATLAAATDVFGRKIQPAHGSTLLTPRRSAYQLESDAEAAVVGPVGELRRLAHEIRRRLEPNQQPVVWREAAWFSERTGGQLDARRLDRARRDGRISPHAATKPKGRWRFKVASVCDVFPQYAHRLVAEGSETRPNPTNPDDSE